MKPILLWLQIFVALLLSAAVLFQQRGGGLFGQETQFYQTLRGLEKKLFIATLILGFFFIALGILSLLL